MSDYIKLRNKIADELATILRDRAEDPLGALYAVQPPVIICQQAALAAAAVLAAFEVGYQMSDSQERESPL